MNERNRLQIQTKRKSPLNRGGRELCACLSSETHDAAVALCYDGYNQRGYEEVCMTMRSAMTGTEGNDADPKIAYGINPVASGVMLDAKPQKETSMTLRSHPGGENGIVQTSGFEDAPSAISALLSQMRYIVRRLTPKEAERLMGLPDSYTIPIGLRRFFDADGEPSPELVAEFQRIFDTFNAIMADYAHKKPPKPKSAKQVAEWLKKISDPATCPDSPRYKGCGNGWATNQPRWILARMLSIGEGIDPFTPPTDKETEP